MKTHRTVPLLATLLALCATITVAQAQASKKTPKTPPAAAHPVAVAVKDTAPAPSAVAAGDSVVVAAADTVHKKKHGGLMGRVKSVAKNKMVQQVAKVAACTVVPGGQVIAGAIDAASSKGAAGAAQGVSGAATGSSCMPGMGAAAGLGSGVSGGMPAGGMGLPGGATMGLSAAQMAAMQAGGAGKMGSPDMMAAQMQQIQQMQQMMALQTGGAGAMTEAPGQTVELSPDLAAELAKGKSTVRNIDWVAGTPGISAAGTPGFTQAMTQLAAGMAQLGGSYRLDLYLDQRYDDAIVKSLGAQRLSAVQTALSGAVGSAQPTPVLEVGKAKKDKHPRLEIVKRK
jgi:hypothetical protein